MKRSEILVLLLLALVSLYILYQSGNLPFLAIQPTQTVTYDFNDGTLQGWKPTVDPEHGNPTSVVTNYMVTKHNGMLKIEHRIYHAWVGAVRQVDLTKFDSVAIDFSFRREKRYYEGRVDPPKFMVLIERVEWSDTDAVLNRTELIRNENKDTIYFVYNMSSTDWVTASRDITDFAAGRYVKVYLLINFKQRGFFSGWFKPAYVDDVSFRGSGVTKVTFRPDISSEGYPAGEQFQIPVKITDAFGQPIPADLMVNYEFNVGGWYETGSAVTNQTGVAIIKEVAGDVAGEGTLKLWATYLGDKTVDSFPIKVKSWIKALQTGNPIQYYNLPISVNLEVVDTDGNRLDPDAMTMEATFNREPITGNLRKEGTGVYRWTVELSISGELVLQVTPQKYGYIGQQETFTVEVKKPSLSLTHNVPDRVAPGDTRTIVLKVLTPQNQLVDADSVTGFIRDPNDIKRDISISRTSQGAYGFTFTFQDQGMYQLKLTAEKAGFNPAELDKTITASTMGGAPLQGVIELLTSPILLGGLAAGILFGVWGMIRRWKKPR